MNKTMKLLILEDDLETLGKLFKKLSELEKTYNIDLSVMVLSEYTQAEELNKTNQNFDLILLDRDCKAAGSFHALDIEKFGVDKVISISSVPEYNQQAEARGVKRTVHKDYSRLDEFVSKLIPAIEKALHLSLL